MELVHANQAAGVLPIGAGFSPETRGRCHVPDRQGGLRKDFIPVHVGNRHFGRRDEEVLVVTEVKQVAFEFRKLSGPGHGLPIDKIGREHFGIAMRPGMDIEHQRG